MVRKGQSKFLHVLERFRQIFPVFRLVFLVFNLFAMFWTPIFPPQSAENCLLPPPPTFIGEQPSIHAPNICASTFFTLKNLPPPFIRMLGPGLPTLPKEVVELRSRLDPQSDPPSPTQERALHPQIFFPTHKYYFKIIYAFLCSLFFSWTAALLLLARSKSNNP